ncbi:MAG TPA: type II secretion system major pseudopilin GspG [Tepidisphaeraceae bacterium]|jgi:general secretion pathway protein G
MQTITRQNSQSRRIAIRRDSSSAFPGLSAVEGSVHRSAFTLIELLLVLVILTVLASVVVPKLTGRAQEAKIAAARTTVKQLDDSMDLFEHDMDRYPTTEEGLGALMVPPSNSQDWKGPYIKGSKLPVDPWNNPYKYQYPGQHNINGVDIWSSGPDGRDGTEDDITNWQ